MTLFDRALSKAYALRSAKLPDPTAAPVPVVRGWVARLRAPSSHAAAQVGNSADAIAPPVPVGDSPQAVPSSGPVPEVVPVLVANPAGDSREDVVYPPDLVVRVDASHATPIVSGEPSAWSWPEISQKLLVSTAGAGLISLADTLESLFVRRRMRAIAFTGHGRMAGRTTLLLTLARLLIERTPLRLLLADFDFENPSLAAALRTSPASDISHLVYEEAAPSALSELIPQRFGLLPLCHPMVPSELTRERQAVLCSLLRNAVAQYDLTLIDAGPWDSEMFAECLESRSFDACLAVSRHAADAAGETLPDAIQKTGIEFLGTVETFVPAVPRNEPHFIR